MNDVTLKKLRIFAASPSDVATERAKLETVVESLKPIADYLGLTLEVVDWRAVVPDAGRPQQVIFDQLQPTSWDIFVGILWHRFGTPSGAQDKSGKNYLSGTEEEFKTAYELCKQHGKPRIVLYRCTRDLPGNVDLDQLKRVREFFKLVEDTKGDYPTLYQGFDTPETFEKLLLDNLQKLLIAYGEHAKTPITPEVAQTLAPILPNNLPRRAAFFGRAKDMDVVMRALSPADRTWGVLVDGIGGIGKSALAVEAAYRAQEAGAFAAFVFVTAKQNILDPGGIRALISPARTLDEFLNETARVLGQPGIAKLAGDDPGGTGKRRALLEALRTTRALLIYDNLETLSKEEQEAVADFLRELPPGCKAIITSRRRGGEGAVWHRLEALDWEAARGIIESEMTRDVALENKLRRAEKDWQKLFDETHGSPLALMHTLGLLRVRAALTFDGALAMLRGNRDADLQQFIFQEARKELTENDRAALGALSFFAPSASFEAWMNVAALTRNALETTIDRLSALSLVDVLAGEECYTLHPLTRAFARGELLAEANTAREIEMRFARYWVEYARQYGGSGKESYKTYDRLEAEWSNLEAAANGLWERANPHPAPPSSITGDEVTLDDKDAARMLNDLAIALRQFLWFGERWEDGVQLGARAYETMYALNDWSSAGWLAYDVAFIHFNCARTGEAALWAERCAQAWARGGSRLEQAVDLRMRGLVARQQQDYNAARRFLQETLVIFRDLKNDAWIAVVLNSLGELERERKNYRAAEQYYRESLEIDTKRDDKEGQAGSVGNLGELAFDRKQWADAHKWFDQELPLAKEVGRQELIAHAQYGLARVHEAEGRADLALPLAQAALKIYERLQHRYLAQARALVERLLKDEG